MMGAQAYAQEADQAPDKDLAVVLAEAKLAVAKAEAELAAAKLAAAEKTKAETATIEEQPEVSTVAATEKPNAEIETAEVINDPAEAEPETTAIAETETPELKTPIIDIPNEPPDVITPISAEASLEELVEPETVEEPETPEPETPEIVREVLEIPDEKISVEPVSITLPEPTIAIPEASAITAVDVILPGLIDLPRHEFTGPVDGCAKTQKGLVMGGGFMLFTCEKLLPYREISDHKSTYQDYQTTFKNSGWSSTLSEEPAKNKTSFTRTDGLGCKVVVDMELWTDRSMNETMMDQGERNNHRQIVFKAWFRGDACETHYDQAELLSGR